MILDRNWRCRLGEIDIVAMEVEGADRSLVFCEVKCRTGLGFGPPLEAITYAKVRKLRRLAGEWLATSTSSHEGYGSTRWCGLLPEKSRS